MTATRRRGPAAQPDPDTASTDDTSVAGSTDDTEPNGLTCDEFRAQWVRERARREMALGSIRAHLEEQPSPRTVRTAARRWCAQITAMASDVITARQNQEHAE
ncbi:hypothetical protein [Streptomyces antibioticus]|uniref:hypothetical protein n=1 Tax=Streptomyces antibioticus TaxID=1890 RepID=UPI0033B78A59